MVQSKENQLEVIEMLEKILSELIEIKTDTKIIANFATLRSEIIQRTKSQSS
jgi:hypothetical protein